MSRQPQRHAEIREGHALRPRGPPPAGEFQFLLGEFERFGAPTEGSQQGRDRGAPFPGVITGTTADGSLLIANASLVHEPNTTTARALCGELGGPSAVLGDLALLQTPHWPWPWAAPGARVRCIEGVCHARERPTDAVLGEACATDAGVVCPRRGQEGRPAVLTERELEMLIHDKEPGTRGILDIVKIPPEPMGLQPYRLDVPDDVLDDLRERLARTRWPDEIPGSGWTYGAELAFMKRLAAYWRDGFDWRRQEAQLNAFDQFTVPLDAIDLHFIHQRGAGTDPVPLLLVHGWPGSVWEFHALIPRLVQSGFTVVAPSLPGFTLSFRPGQRRVGLTEMADLFARLMTDVLGYERFAAQGGDWGGYVVGLLAHSHANELIGAHLNFLPLPLDIPFPDEPSEDELAYMREIRHWRREEVGYSTIQGTRPQTPAYALTDSPAGLAAWITEKFHVWTDHDGDLEQAVDLDSLLTNITLYWVTGAINSSFWPYYDVRHGAPPIPRERCETPVAYASFPREIHHPPRSFAEQVFNIRRWTEMPRGGHFAALEAPELLAEDVAAFFRSLPRD